MTNGNWYVYIMASQTGTLYVGMTNNLERRAWEHRHSEEPSFTHRYGIRILVYFETSGSPLGAIAREKQLKAWRREKKVHLIERANPKWEDLMPGI